MSDKILFLGSLSLLVACSSGGSVELKSDVQNDLTTFVEGNPTCQDLGFGDTEFKEEDPAGGESTFQLGDCGEITIDHDTDTNTFDWVSDCGIDAIIVKGGPDAYVYSYNPEAFSDTGLVSPLNPGGNVPAISHISVCYDEEPDLCKDVQCDGETECTHAGVCNQDTGECEYEDKEQGTECSDDDDNPCSVAVCDGEGACVKEAGNEGMECRSATGDCGSAEYCDGESMECPEDTHDNQSLCRESAGVCDPAEFCDGSSSECPEDVLSGSSVVCNESAGVCDPAEYCTGDSADCPADELDPYGTVCGGIDDCGHHNICTGDSAECTDHSSLH